MFFFFAYCSRNLKEEVDYKEWVFVKDSADFDLFFNFALKVKDSILYAQCIDSLEKYQPKKECLILSYRNYYNQKTDSIVLQKFSIEDLCHIEINYKTNNVLVINIDDNNQVETYHIDDYYQNYKDVLKYLYLTEENNFPNPDIRTFQYSGIELKAKHIGVFIHSKRLPDTLSKKTSWNKLIIETKNIFEIISEIKNIKALEIYNSSFNELNSEEKSIINISVPTIINIYFYIEQIPPPPPPPPIIK